MRKPAILQVCILGEPAGALALLWLNIYLDLF
jgi:hypothetical protein